MKNKYLLGISWFMASLVISVLNDTCMKYLSDILPSMQIAFMRFGFGVLTLLPFMIYYGREAFYTPRGWIHISRGTILFVSISIWIFALPKVQIANATLTTFTIPLFVLILAPIFLKEKVSKSLVLATVLGFVGSVISFDIAHVDFDPDALWLLAPAAMFATLDIINKKYVRKESMLSMLFYSALVTMILGFIPAITHWTQPSLNDTLICLYLGAGSNLILFCLLKAFSYVKASSVAPYRYLELLFSTGIGIAFFNEMPSTMLALGALLIIPSALFVTAKYADKQA